ncbi:MAG: xanthine dehydrogenase family protein subunit M [Desulfobacteraceae bacterium]|jgi:carbon-monoxide dehydrogenase medium subunit
MPTSKFDYHSPGTVEEASRLLLELGEGAFVLAGGTDLIVKCNHGMIQPKAVVSLNAIETLKSITFKRKQGLTIGAGARLAEVEAHRDIRRRYPAVAYAASVTANTQIRNMGTVAGNLCNAAPSAENAPTLMAMNAEVAVLGKNGERRLPLEDFFKGPGKTALQPGEILTSIFVPLPPPRSGASYQHISARGKVDISAVCVGTMVTLNQSGACEDVRIVLGAVAPVPMRAVKGEGILKGKKPTQERLEQSAEQAMKESKPISDLRASASYRKAMVRVLTKRALQEALQRARKTKG